MDAKADLSTSNDNMSIIFVVGPNSMNEEMQQLVKCKKLSTKKADLLSALSNSTHIPTTGQQDILSIRNFLTVH